jgi:xanthine/uracil permease
MNFNLFDINYLAILVAAVINQAIGSQWYSLRLFGKAWAEDAKINISTVDKKVATRGLILGSILALIVYFLIAVFLQFTNSHCWSTGLLIGFLLGVLVSLQLAVYHVYESKSLRLFLINASFTVLTFSIGGTIIGLW